MEGKWLYDIFVGDSHVGDQGEYEFDTKEEAEIDANDYIENGLAKFENLDPDEFRVEYYQSLC